MPDERGRSELERVWSIISHDFASPLLVIQSSWKQLDEELIPRLLDAYQKAKAAGLDIPNIPWNRLEMYQKMLLNTKSTINRVRQLISRWDRKLLPGKFHPSKQSVNIVACVKTAIDHYQTSYSLEDKSRIHIEVEDATVLGDEEMIRHILYELFANAEYAFESMGGDESDVIVFLSSTTDNEGYHLHIKNKGSPIAGQDLARLFDPYFSTKTSHIGLGLTFCQRAMREMDGNIVCYSADNGVTFVLKFPLVKN